MTPVESHELFPARAAEGARAQRLQHVAGANGFAPALELRGKRMVTVRPAVNCNPTEPTMALVASLLRKAADGFEALVEHRVVLAVEQAQKEWTERNPANAELEAEARAAARLREDLAGANERIAALLESAAAFQQATGVELLARGTWGSLPTPTEAAQLGRFFDALRGAKTWGEALAVRLHHARESMSRQLELVDSLARELDSK